MSEKNLEIVYVADWDGHYVKLDGVVIHSGEFLHEMRTLVYTAQLLGATVIQREVETCDDPDL